MSSTDSDTPSNLIEKYTIKKTEDFLDNISEPHPDLVLPSIEQVWSSETRYKSFTETFYYWVNSETTLISEDLDVRHTKHPRRNHYSDGALLAINPVVAHYHTKEEALAPAM